MVNLKNIKMAHRGLHNNLNIPENSLKAFKKAIDRQLPIELDVHLLKDNTLVVFHDDNLKRMTGVNKEIKDFTYDELSKITLLDTDEKIPTLKEVLDLVAGQVLLNIEIKYHKNYKDVGREVSNLLDNYKGDFLIQSFFPKIIFWFKKNRPNYIRGILVSKKRKERKMATSTLIYHLLKPNYYAINKKMIDDKRIVQLREKNIPLLFWTIKGKDEIDKYSKYNDGLICEKF